MSRALASNQEVLDKLWEVVEPKLYCTKEQYLAGLAGWDIAPHEADGRLVGAVVTRGSELHFEVFGGKWHLTRADIRRYLEPILAEHGVVTTKTPIESTRQLRFNRVLGFSETHRDEEYVYLALHSLPFSRNT